MIMGLRVYGELSVGVNMAKKNAINNESQDLTVDPGASGDSFVQFDINGTGEFRIGVDDTDSDKFKISQGSALGTNDTFIMTASGERTMPLQSCFLAHMNSSPLNITGDGTAYTMAWDSEEFDQNGDFNTGTYKFTAPVTGIYKLFMNVMILFPTASHTSEYLDIVTTSDTYRRVLNPFAMVGGNSVSADIYIITKMTAADTAYGQITVSGGAKTVDIQGNTGAGSIVCYFSGSLVC
jgi:hypothetical protein